MGLPWPEMRAVRRASHSGVPGGRKLFGRVQHEVAESGAGDLLEADGAEGLDRAGEEDGPAAVGGYVLVGQGLTLRGELRRAASRRQAAWAALGRVGEPAPYRAT